MTVTLQIATPDHAPAITNIQRAVWPHETSTDSQVVRALADPDHGAWVAVARDRVVGFVDSFATVAASGESRWEVDLLAVHPDFHGQKIGQRLITAATQHARQQAAAFARALIQIDNRASQGAFQRCGYQCADTVYTLMVSSAAPTYSVPIPDNAHLVQVNTMNYHGLWLEGDLTPKSLAAARSERARQGRTIAGALIASTDHANLAAATALGYEPISQFQWWRCSL